MASVYQHVRGGQSGRIAVSIICHCCRACLLFRLLVEQCSCCQVLSNNLKGAQSKAGSDCRNAGVEYNLARLSGSNRGLFSECEYTGICTPDLTVFSHSRSARLEGHEIFLAGLIGDPRAFGKLTARFAVLVVMLKHNLMCSGYIIWEKYS